MSEKIETHESMGVPIGSLCAINPGSLLVSNTSNNAS